MRLQPRKRHDNRLVIGHRGYFVTKYVLVKESVRLKLRFCNKNIVPIRAMLEEFSIILLPGKSNVNICSVYYTHAINDIAVKKL